MEAQIGLKYVINTTIVLAVDSTAGSYRSNRLYRRYLPCQLHKVYKVRHMVDLSFRVYLRLWSPSYLAR